MIKNFYDLEVWQESYKLTLNIYKLTCGYPKEEPYGLTSQLRRASSSIIANIAEGFARYHYKDKVRFYHNARGSLAETQNFLLLSKDLNYITQADLVKIGPQTKIIGKLLNGIIRSALSQSNN